MPSTFRKLTSSLYIKILVGFVAILLLSLFLGYGTLSELRTVGATAEGMQTRIQSIQILAEMRATLDIIEARLVAKASKEDISVLVRSFEGDLNDLGANAPDVVGKAEASDAPIVLRSAVRAFKTSIGSASEVRMTPELSAALEDARQAIESVGRSVEDETSSALKEQQQLLSESTRRLLMNQIIVLLVGVVLAMFLARMITGPIEILRESVLSVARGDYGSKVAFRSRDEIGELADAFNEMSTALKRYTTSLSATVEERTKELNEKVKALDALAKELDESAVMLIRRDVALTRATERLEDLDSMKSEFISVAAHQLRTPLSAIKWTLSLLLDGDAGEVSSEQRELFEKAAASNERMIRLIDDMLTVTRIESGKTAFVSVPVHVGEILTSIVHEVTEGATKKGLALSLVPIPEHRTIIGDAEKLSSVFQNLLENAIRYTPKGGTISVSLSQKEHAVEIVIADTGIGIPEKQKSAIFTKFFRADNAVKTVTDGTGLGLYVAKAIVEKHHGTLRFESSEGKGTTFYIVLPNEDAPFLSGM